MVKFLSPLRLESRTSLNHLPLELGLKGDYQ